MGFNSPPKTVESVEKPKNKFLELFEYKGRRSESAQTKKIERNIKIAEAYDAALSTVHTQLEKAYCESVNKEWPSHEKIDQDELNAFINSLSSEQIERHIDLMKARWEGFQMAKEEDRKEEEATNTQIAIDGLEEVRVKLVEL